jgi:hypothetical protein
VEFHPVPELRGVLTLTFRARLVATSGAAGLDTQRPGQLPSARLRCPRSAGSGVDMDHHRHATTAQPNWA